MKMAMPMSADISRRYGLRVADPRRTALCAAVLSVMPYALHGQQDSVLHESPPAEARSGSGPYFYRDLGYGSEAYYGPLAVILNKGFAISLMEGVSRKLSEFPYGFESVTDALAHPIAAIERSGGFGKFLKEELLPLTWNPSEARWWPNYTGHLIEGGMHWRQLKEWYEANGVPMAGLLSGITTMSAAFLNEMYETNGTTQGIAGTVADLYLFDLAGIALFTSDDVARFFAEKLHANLWTGQASIVFPSGETENNASHIYLKVPWGVVPRSSVFFWTGVGGGLGLSFHRANGLDVSVGAGTDAAGRRVDPETGLETAELTFGAGLFVDRNGSLLASVHVSQVEHRLLRVNLYPGVLGGLGRHLGAWLIMSHDFAVRFGISSGRSLGFGMGFGR